MKNKGFTLVELIAVIVILGMILLIVFPSTTRLMRENEEKEYDTYYDAVKKSIEVYARTKRDDIGGTTGVGCINSSPYVLTLSALIDKDYAKSFDQEKDVVCKTPDEFTTSELISLGIDSSKSYESIRIENNEGKITVDFSMICYKEGKSKPEYTHLVEKTKSCDRYVAEVQNSLVKVISSSGENKINATLDTDSQYYVNKSATNNYVWYSGMMWRIISYNTNDKTIKMVTDENISTITYDTNDNNFKTSNINIWLNNNFINSLRNSDKYILESEWNYTATTTAAKPARTSVASAKVGLMSYYEYCKIVNAGTSCNTGAGFLDIGKNYWLLSDYSGSNVWYIDSSNTAKNGTVKAFMGVRPTVVLKPNVTFIAGGNGTASNPYRLTGDTGANVGTSLNTRYAGEYVKINNINFRIISTNAAYTKLVTVDPLDIADTQFHNFDVTYSNNSFIGEYLLTWSTPINDYLAEADFCRTKITNTTSQTVNCPIDDILTLKIAIPKIGDLFTANTGKEYWTLTNETDSTLYVVQPNGAVKGKGIEEYSGIRPVIVLKNTIVVAGGNGTLSSPYTIK